MSRWQWVPKRWPIRAAVILAVLGTAVGLGWIRARPPGGTRAAARPGADSVQAQSVQAQYVDDQACRACHEAIFERFARSEMGRSWGRPSPADLGPDGPNRRVRAITGRPLEYEVRWRDGHLEQREVRRDAAGRVSHELVRAAAYVIGSGDHGRAYVTETNGYLKLMPAAWFSLPRRWGLSPGYERENLRFNRPVPDRCVACHNAYPNFVAGSINRYRPPVPLGIGCQRCHGPGSEHLAEQEGRDHGSVNPDGRTIINPRRLARGRRDDVCQQCHLQADESFPTRGHTAFDFRPGMRLRDVRHDLFVRTAATAKIGFATHRQRLKLSRCSKASGGRLDCILCHDPHRPRAEVSEAEYDRKCLGCHAAAACRRPADGSPADRQGACTVCHMARRNPTQVAHAIFTDHWIRARPDTAPSDSSRPSSGPVEFVDAWTGAAPESIRAAAIATAQYADHRVSSPVNLARATQLLEQCVAADPGDGEVLFWLGVMEQKTGHAADAVPVLIRAARARPDDPLVYTTAGQACEQAGDIQGAAYAYRRALEVCPDFLSPYEPLAVLELERGEPGQAIQILKQALDYDPDRPMTLILLAEASLHVDPSTARPWSWVRRAIQLDPDSAMVHWVEGHLEWMDGRRVEAAAAFERSLACQPDYVPALRMLAQTRLDLGDRPGARRAAEAILRQQPDDPEAHRLVEQASLADDRKKK